MSWSSFTTIPHDLMEKYLPSGRIKRNVIMLSSVTLFGQVLSVVFSPIWTRLYSPADYGIFGAYSSILLTIMAIAGLSLEQAIPIAEDENSAYDVLVLSILSVATIGILSGIILFAAGDIILKSTNLLLIAPYTWLIPIGVLWSGAYQSLNYLALRDKTISLLARTRMMQAVTSQVTIGTFAIVRPSPYGFILSGIIANSAGMSTLAKNVKIKDQGGARRFIATRQLKKALVRYWRFSALATPSTLLNRLGLFLPPLLLASYYGVEAAGWFVLAQRFITLPMSLVGGAVSQVFQSEASELVRNDPKKLLALLDKITNKTFKAGFFILAVGILAPLFFPIVFGPRWKTAGEFAFYLSFYCAIGIVVSPISILPVIVQRLNVKLVLDGLRAFLVFLAFYIPHFLALNASWAVICYSSVMIVLYMIGYIYYRYLAISFSKAK